MSDWQEQANCREMDPGLFYPRDGAVNQEVILACASCPVKDPCYMHALQHEYWGYWAGTTEKDRRKRQKAAGISVRVNIDSVLFPRNPHGTLGGYKQHLRAGTPACDACLEANANYRNPQGRRHYDLPQPRGDRSEAHSVQETEDREAESVR